jgi:hypothetical protein
MTLLSMPSQHPSHSMSRMDLKDDDDDDEEDEEEDNDEPESKKQRTE